MIDGPVAYSDSVLNGSNIDDVCRQANTLRKLPESNPSGPAGVVRDLIRQSYESYQGDLSFAHKTRTGHSARRGVPACLRASDPLCSGARAAPQKRATRRSSRTTRRE